MPAANIARNRKQFIKELLDTKKGEKIINGSADGRASIIPRYHEYYADRNAPKPKDYKMSLFPTNRRIVVYQARSWPKCDQYAQLPLTEIDEISFLVMREENRLVCVTLFIAADDSRYPSIEFKMDCTGHPDDLDQYKIVLSSISKLSGVPIDDYTPRGGGAGGGQQQARRAGAASARPSAGQARTAAGARPPQARAAQQRAGAAGNPGMRGGTNAPRQARAGQTGCAQAGGARRIPRR